MLIWAAVNGWVPWTSQSCVFDWMWNSRMACSVITVFGAEVPNGSAPTSWTTGFARHCVAAVQPEDEPPGPCF